MEEKEETKTESTSNNEDQNSSRAKITKLLVDSPEMQQALKNKVELVAKKTRFQQDFKATDQELSHVKENSKDMYTGFVERFKDIDSLPEEAQSSKIDDFYKEVSYYKTFDKELEAAKSSVSTNGFTKQSTSLPKNFDELLKNPERFKPVSENSDLYMTQDEKDRMDNVSEKIDDLEEEYNDIDRKVAVEELNKAYHDEIRATKKYKNNIKIL